MKYRIILILTIIFLPGILLDARPLKWGYILSSSAPDNGELVKYFRKYTVISMTGFRINRDGALKYRFNSIMRRIVKSGEKTGRDIFPLVTFDSTAAGKRVLGSRRLTGISTGNIVKLIDRYGFKGVHIDFEYLPPEYSRSFGKFLRLLKRCMGKRELTAALFPQVDFPGKLSGFHELSLLSPFLDQVVIMCYDLHCSRTGPGPVTGIEWAERNINHFLKFFPAEKIWLGVPGYGYRWTNRKNGKAISSKSASALSGNIKQGRNSSGTIEIRYWKDGREIRIDYSDKKTRQLLEDLSEKYRLKGTALWRLGLED